MTIPVELRINQMEKELKELKNAVEKIQYVQTETRQTMERYTVLTNKLNGSVRWLMSLGRGGRNGAGPDTE